MRRRPSLAGAIGLALLGVGWIAEAVWAGNTVHPRTPVLWPDAPCIQTVDRSSSTSFAFAYSIAAEDTQLTIDELDDSRTHQFFAFCRQWPAGSPPPNYVSLADLQRAIDNGSELDATKLDDPEATLETSPTWADCWTRVTADDARRPITFAAAAEPVVWDTSAVAAGTWAIAGYTWEPPYNLWRRAPWVVRVHDGDVPLEQLQPAAALGEVAELLTEDEATLLPLCLAADAGATVRVAWSSDDQPPSWHEGEAIPSEGATMLELPFAAPPEAWGLTLVLRVRVEGTGGEYSTHPLGALVVIKPGGPDPSDESGTAGESSDTTDTTDSASEGDSSGAGSSEGDPAVDAGGTCACTSAAPRSGPGGLALALVLLALRRRR